MIATVSRSLTHVSSHSGPHSGPQDSSEAYEKGKALGHFIFPLIKNYLVRDLFSFDREEVIFRSLRKPISRSSYEDILQLSYTGMPILLCKWIEDIILVTTNWIESQEKATTILAKKELISLTLNYNEIHRKYTQKEADETNTIYLDSNSNNQMNANAHSTSVDEAFSFENSLGKINVFFIFSLLFQFVL